MNLDNLRSVMFCLLSSVLCLPACGGDTGTTEGEAEAESEAEAEAEAEAESEAEAEAEAEGDCEITSCDDGVDCTEDTLDAEDCKCENTPLHGRCSPGMICDTMQGCASPPSCSVTNKCPDLDGACLVESCNLATATCVYTPLDTDGDEHPPQICTSVGGDDCDDSDDDIYPGAPEQCDGEDNDCDGTVDDFSEPCGTDVGECMAGTRTCLMGGWTACTGVGPTSELCDGLDNDCDGMTDELWLLGALCDGLDTDLCLEGMVVCNTTGTGTTCTDTTTSTAELCNGTDDDCDGVIDEGVDIDEDGWPSDCGSGGVLSDCDDSDPTINPDALEFCDGVDTNCDGIIDSDCWSLTSTSSVPVAREYHAAVWTGSEMVIWGGWDGGTYFNSGGGYNPDTDTWVSTTAGGAPSARGFHTAVWTGSEMIVWGGWNGSADAFNTGGRYNATTDTWAATETSGAPFTRYDHTAVWTGSEMIVWGGFDDVSTMLNTGGRYNPVSNSWISTSAVDAPAARAYHTAIWTGSEMIVWGGSDASLSRLNSGGRYNPDTDGWTPTSTIVAVSARLSHSSIWTGSEMVIWGGVEGTFPPIITNTGGRYDPFWDIWTSTTAGGAPSPRESHSSIWTGSEMIVWDGNTEIFPLLLTNTGGQYNPTTNIWSATTTSGAPSGRFNYTTVWTGSEMIVWGGTYGSYLNTGGRYMP